jgi:hypothetical protein
MHSANAIQAVKIPVQYAAPLRRYRSPRPFHYATKRIIRLVMLKSLTLLYREEERSDPKRNTVHDGALQGHKIYRLSMHNVETVDLSSSM